MPYKKKETKPTKKKTAKKKISVKKLKSVDFAPHLNSKFNFHHESSKKPVMAELVQVKAHIHEHAEDTSEAAQSIRRAFSLVFRCPKATSLPQDVYTVEHDKMEKIDLFFVPIDRPDEKGLKYYEAVIS